MKLHYTGIRNNLTELLVDEAKSYVDQGFRVFYIAPNSLSFEKERAVLSYLEEGASFDIMVTRFGQMARYLVLNEAQDQKTIDDLGLTMLFFRVLSQLDESELKVYGKLKQDMDFIGQLLDLYKELQRANLSVLDLEKMESPEKQADLVKIFTGLEELLQANQFEAQTKLTQFRQLVETGKLDQELNQLVLIVDGFTRFSAEEEALITALNGRVKEIVIGTYASQKAYASTYIEGNLYQAGVEFLRHLAIDFATKPTYLGAEEVMDSLGKISKNIESRYDFSDQQVELTKEDRDRIILWDVINQKEEIEQVARSIRQRLYQGARYKDILVLLGDVGSYQLQLRTAFDKYEIPHYFGKAESMSHHPLVHFIESLERLKRYNFRSEDLLNLLKSGLYGTFSQSELDRFEQYILFADIKGQAKFTKDFSVNSRANYDLEGLNQFRQAVMDPLTQLFKAQVQTGSSLLQKLMTFLEAVQLPKNMSKLSQGLGDIEQEKEEQVWKSFCHILEELQAIFGQEKLRLDDFLAILKTGMLAATYRTVPATVDVVTIKSYDLIEPHTAKYVYAIGLSQANFPKIAKNTSLLTEEEKTKVNEASGQLAHFDLVSQENIKKNHSTMISLINAAREQLVLSTPQLYKEAEQVLSPYLKLLLDMEFSLEEKGREGLDESDVMHYKGLLSRLVEANRDEFDPEWTKEEATFWSVVVRYLRKKLEKEDIHIPAISAETSSVALEADTLASLYPADQPLVLSASSLTDFYKNEYLYFIKHVLRLQEQDSIHPDARSHGNFLHRIFERVTMDQTEADFDEKLTKAISETRQEKTFQSLYGADASSQFSEEVLLDIAKASSLVLREGSQVAVLANEASFGQEDVGLLDLGQGRSLKIVGKIDRLDQLADNHALGVVDYKSSSNSFKIDRFYNGLSPQLVTYIAAVQQLPEFSQSEKIFGAMYLHLLDPIVKLADTKGQDQVLTEAYKSLVYKGLFLEEEANRLNQVYYKSKASLYSQEELALLLQHNQALYKEAGQTILTGRFAINPYTEDGKSVAGEQLKAITGFEANLHMGQARQLVKGGKREDWLDRMKGGDVE
ncbi:TPA: ATP-dependent nuclease subunit B [Streptococcus suis]